MLPPALALVKVLQYIPHLPPLRELYDCASEKPANLFLSLMLACHHVVCKLICALLGPPASTCSAATRGTASTKSLPQYVQTGMKISNKGSSFQSNQVPHFLRQSRGHLVVKCHVP